MSVSERYSKSPLTEIKEPYILKNKAEVLTFLESNSLLVQILEEMSPTLKLYFPDSRLFLELITDPDALDELHLAVFIATSLPINEAIGKYDQFFKDYWLKVVKSLPREFRDKVTVDLEF